MKKPPYLQAIFLASLVLTPVIVLAQSGSDVSSGIKSFSGLIDTLSQTVVKSLATLFLSLGLLAFFYGIVEYIWGRRQGDSGKVKVGNDFMTWGLVALFVMFSVYGIIKLGQGILFNGKDVTTIAIPNIQFKSGTSGTGNTTAPSSPGLNNGGATNSSGGLNNGGSPNYSSGASDGSVNCDNQVNGFSCTTASGSVGVCGDNGNGARGCMPAAATTNYSSGAGNGSVNCDEQVNGFSCTTASGSAGVCGDNGNGARGCMPK